MRLADIAPPGAGRAGRGGSSAPTLLDILVASTAAMAGIDTVGPHGRRAGRARGATPGSRCCRPISSASTTCLFEAARRAGVKRVLFASSHHAAGFHRAQHADGGDAGPRAPTATTASARVFGEAMGRMYADKFGLQVLSMRIGAYRDRPSDRAAAGGVDQSARHGRAGAVLWIEAPDFGYATVYGVSANTRSFWNNSTRRSSATRRGTTPRTGAAEVLAGPPEDPLAARFQGGWYCAKDFVGQPRDVQAHSTCSSCGEGLSSSDSGVAGWKSQRSASAPPAGIAVTAFAGRADQMEEVRPTPA